MPDSPFDDSEVHVLDARAGRRGRGAWIAGIVALLALGGLGAWVALTDPFAERQTVASAPPAADNELGEAWSFETTERTDAREAWTVSDHAPAGFSFVPAAAASGALGARSQADDGGWAELVASRGVELGMHDGGVELAARADGRVQLTARFEAAGRGPIDVVAAVGDGEVGGVVPVPPGSETVRAVVRASGPADVDDVVLRLVDTAPAEVEPRGVYGVLDHGGTLVVARGSVPNLVLEPPSVRTADGRGRPPGVGWDPGEDLVARPDGASIGCRTGVTSDGPRLVVETDWGRGSDGLSAVRVVRVLGGLADEPIGVSAAGAGFQAFDDDFAVADVAWLTFGRTQDRLVLRVDEPVVVTGTRRADGSFELSLVSPLREGPRRLTLQTSFTDERVAAVARRDRARALYEAGELGAALAEAEAILRDQPYDEDVLRAAAELRGELVALMQARLDAIDAALDDALFLASADRCREVLTDARAAAETFAGSSAEERFVERAEIVRDRAAALLEADRRRRAERLDAIATSLEEFGGYEWLAAEYRDTLDRWLAPPGAAPDGPTGEGGR